MELARESCFGERANERQKSKCLLPEKGRKEEATKKEKKGDEEIVSEDTKIKPRKKKETIAFAMPADDAKELFDVVDEVTGEPLFVSESGQVLDRPAEAGGGARGDGGGGVADSADGKSRPSTSTSTSTKKSLTVPRGLAHSNGTWHASVYVHVSRKSDGAFLLQKRSAKKDVCPLRWDLSCAEHVASGEGRVEAALRGLKEELGMGSNGIDAERLGRALGPPRKAELRLEGPPLVWDREVVTSYWLRDLDVGESESGGGGGAPVVRFEEDEVSEVRWVSQSELKREVEEAPERFTPWFVADLRARPELLLLEEKERGGRGGGG